MSINLILRSLLFSFKSRDWEEENIIFSLRIGPIQWLRVTEQPDDGFCNSRLFFIRFLRQINFLIFFVFFQMSWSGAVFQFCLHFLHSHLTFWMLFVVLECNVNMENKTLTKSILTPFPCQRPLRDWTRWYLVGGISISTIHDQFSNQCSRGCCCWCTDCQGWNIKLYTILVFISSLIISTPFHFHTYC